MDFAEAHKSIWQLFIIRPGGVVPKGSIVMGLLPTLAGTGLLIRAEELGAYAADLAINGDEQGPLIENQAMVVKGRKLLSSRA
jgi:hypothetical protein